MATSSFPADLPVLSLEDVSRESVYRRDWLVAILGDSNVLIFSIQQVIPGTKSSIKALEFFLSAGEGSWFNTK